MLNARVRVCIVHGAITRNNDASKQSVKYYRDERRERALAYQLPNEVSAFFHEYLFLIQKQHSRSSARAG